MSAIANLFKTPKPPVEDPKVAAMRNAEEQRSERDKLVATQDQLGLETRLRNRGFGLRSLQGQGGALRSLLGSG